jgi:hypothetical protein
VTQRRRHRDRRAQAIIGRRNGSIVGLPMFKRWSVAELPLGWRSVRAWSRRRRDAGSLEGINRPIQAFNATADRFNAQPAAKGYRSAAAADPDRHRHSQNLLSGGDRESVAAGQARAVCFDTGRL